MLLLFYVHFFKFPICVLMPRDDRIKYFAVCVGHRNGCSKETFGWKEKMKWWDHTRETGWKVKDDEGNLFEPLSLWWVWGKWESGKMGGWKMEVWDRRQCLHMWASHGPNCCCLSEPGHLFLALLICLKVAAFWPTGIKLEIERNALFLCICYVI